MEKEILIALGIILLLLGIAVQPCIAVVQKEIIKVTIMNPDDTWYLANLSMDFGEYISNDRIEYESMSERSGGDWTVNVKINFRCPENRRIVVRYWFAAVIYDPHDLWHIFFDVKDTVTITNGSNPPDINDSKTLYIASRPRSLDIYLLIKANLTAYEYLNGEWIWTHNDEIDHSIQDNVEFSKCRTIARTWFLLNLFERFPMLERLLNFLM